MFSAVCYSISVYDVYRGVSCMLLLCMLYTWGCHVRCSCVCCIPDTATYVAPVYAVYLRLPYMLLLCMLYTWGCHICCSCGLDLLYASEAVLLQDLVKICDDFIEKAETLHALVIGLQLHVELREVGDGGEYDASAVTLLMVQLLQSHSVQLLYHFPSYSVFYSSWDIAVETASSAMCGIGCCLTAYLFTSKTMLSNVYSSHNVHMYYTQNKISTLLPLVLITSYCVGTSTKKNILSKKCSHLLSVSLILTFTFEHLRQFS